MADKTKSLNASVKNALEFLKSKGHFAPGFEWEWTDTREIIWRIIRQEVLPEVGFNPDSQKPEDIEDLKQARAKYDAAFDAGYTVESSNLGKHASANGYFDQGAEAGAKAKYC